MYLECSKACICAGFEHFPIALAVCGLLSRVPGISPGIVFGPLAGANRAATPVANFLRLWLAYPMLTRSQFVLWLESRRSVGESLAEIGASLGVSHAAVQRWLGGGKPSDTALLLAEQLCCAPLEMAPGLPLAAERERGH
jgi:hypothetical protein